MRPTRINIFLALFFSASAFATTIPTDSTNNGNDSIQHSISGFESYFEKDVIQQSLLERLPFRSINRLVLLQPGSFYIGNDTYSSFGLLYGENATVIDGMRVKMPAAFPYRSISRVGLLNNQTAIQLGNSAAGFLLIETPEKIDSFSVETEFLTSSPFSLLGNHVLDFNIRAPIKFRKESHVKKELLPSFLLSMQISTTNDLNPSQSKHSVLSEEAQEHLNATPLMQSPFSNSFSHTAEYLSHSVFEQKDFADAPQKAVGSFVKLNIPVTKSFVFTAGTYFQFDKRKDYVHANELFNAANYPESTMRNFDSYLRASHEMNIKNGIKINQQFQFNFSNYYLKAHSARHQDNFFDYGHIGYYEVFSEPVFSYGEDGVSGNEGWRLVGYQDTLVTFSAGTLNPVMSNNTSSYYALAGADAENYYESLFQIQANGGMLNGDRPRIANDLWYNAGRVFNN